MYAMLGLAMAMGLVSPEDNRRRQESSRGHREARIATAVPWDPDMKWGPCLTIQAASYKPLSLFEVERSESDVRRATPEQVVTNPTGRWAYVEKRLPRGGTLYTARGSRQGNVMFDGDVTVPALHELDEYGQWERDPWMSLTPMEMFSLRAGTRLARGRVVVAGLGLGHQLIEVSKRRNVRQILLVERDRHLLEWLLPRITPHMDHQLDGVIVGDAYDVLPTLEADVALVDICAKYGNNDRSRALLQRSCKGIGRIWVWGSAII